MMDGGRLRSVKMREEDGEVREPQLGDVRGKGSGH